MRRSISSVDIETLSGAARQVGIAQAEASRCVELARVPCEEFARHVADVKEEEGREKEGSRVLSVELLVDGA